MPLVPTRLPLQTHNAFDILTEWNDDEDVADDAIPIVSEVEWPTTIVVDEHGRNGRTRGRTNSFASMRIFAAMSATRPIP